MSPEEYCEIHLGVYHPDFGFITHEEWTIYYDCDFIFEPIPF